MVLFIGPQYGGKEKAAAEYARRHGKKLADYRYIGDVARLSLNERWYTIAKLQKMADEYAENYDIVLISETGSGLVPANRHDRASREAAGHLALLLAERADEVFRVSCGLYRRLK